MPDKSVFGKKPFGPKAYGEIKAGDCFYNLKRGSCLRVISISNGSAKYQSWRPDGRRLSNQGQVAVASLSGRPYVPISQITLAFRSGEEVDVLMGGD